MRWRRDKKNGGVEWSGGAEWMEEGRAHSLASLEKRASCNSRSLSLSLSLCSSVFSRNVYARVLKSDPRGERRFGRCRARAREPDADRWMARYKMSETDSKKKTWTDHFVTFGVLHFPVPQFILFSHGMFGWREPVSNQVDPPLPPPRSSRRTTCCGPFSLPYGREDGRRDGQHGVNWP